jgi:asparagine synthase (glutamine-hydrolysing)
VERVKSPYPSTQDPGYAAALQQQAKEALAEQDNAVFDLVDRSWVTEIVDRDPRSLTTQQRGGLDRLLDLYHWIDMYSPNLELS